jgi:uncharacterized protein
LPVEPIELALAALMAALAYFVFGVCGFGTGLVSIPVLSYVWPVRFVLPVIAVLDCAMSLLVTVRERRNAEYREMLRFIPFLIIGLAAGVTLLVSLPPTATLAALGAAVTVFGAWSFAARGPRRPVHRAWAMPAGLIAGAASGLFGVGGPPTLIYFSGRINDKTRLRATLAAMLLVSVSSRLVMLAIAGLLTHREALTALVLAPFAIAGVQLGTRVHLKLSREQFARVVALLVIVAGVSLLVRAAASPG